MVLWPFKGRVQTGGQLKDHDEAHSSKVMTMTAVHVHTLLYTALRPTVCLCQALFPKVGLVFSMFQISHCCGYWDNVEIRCVTREQDWDFTPVPTKWLSLSSCFPFSPSGNSLLWSLAVLSDSYLQLTPLPVFLQLRFTNLDSDLDLGVCLWLLKVLLILWHTIKWWLPHNKYLLSDPFSLQIEDYILC
jgi:hypothetical protein